MLLELSPLLRSDREHWSAALARLMPDAEVHPSIVWMVRTPNDSVPLGSYVRQRAIKHVFSRQHAHRLLVLTDTAPSTLSALIALQNHCRSGARVPLHAVFANHAVELNGIEVERVVPCRLFDIERHERLRVRYGQELSEGTLAALPSDGWHVCLVTGWRLGVRWDVLIALMDAWLFWDEVVERRWLTVASLVELNLSAQESAHLRYRMEDGMVAQIHATPARVRLGGEEGET